MEGSVFIPQVDLSDRQIDPGKYGRMRIEWLRDCKPIIFGVLKMEPNYGRDLVELNKKAMQMERELIANFAEARKAEMPDKASHPIEWAGWMNMLKAQAEEIVRKEVVEVMPEMPAGVKRLPEKIREGVAI